MRRMSGGAILSTAVAMCRLPCDVAKGTGSHTAVNQGCASAADNDKEPCCKAAASCCPGLSKGGSVDACMSLLTNFRSELAVNLPLARIAIPSDPQHLRWGPWVACFHLHPKGTAVSRSMRRKELPDVMMIFGQRTSVWAAFCVCMSCRPCSTWCTARWSVGRSLM